MDIPVEVVRKGLAEDYIQAYEKTDITERKLSNIKKVHSEYIKEFFEILTEEFAFFANGSSVYIGDNVWRHALIIDEMAKKLVRIAAEYTDIKAKHKQAEEDIKLIMDKVNIK